MSKVKIKNVNEKTIKEKFWVWCAIISMTVYVVWRIFFTVPDHNIYGWVATICGIFLVAAETISMWESVRRGEDRNIFPFQEEADVMFNSALVYELAVLKQYAEPLLFGIPKDVPEYAEAKRLLKFLDYFLGVSSENIPHNSMIREFVGGSCFREKDGHGVFTFPLKYAKLTSF